MAGVEKFSMCRVRENGTRDETITHPRDRYKEAIKRSAKKIYIVHNHPSGDPKPSKEDKEITKRFFDSGELLLIEAIDHIILGNNCYYSFRADKVYNLSKSLD